MNHQVSWKRQNDFALQQGFVRIEKDLPPNIQLLLSPSFFHSLGNFHSNLVNHLEIPTCLLLLPFFETKNMQRISSQIAPWIAMLSPLKSNIIDAAASQTTPAKRNVQSAQMIKYQTSYCSPHQWLLKAPNVASKKGQNPRIERDFLGELWRTKEQIIQLLLVKDSP